MIQKGGGLMYSKPNNIKFCNVSIYLFNKCLIEICQIINHKSNDKSPIRSSDTFRFYLFTLHNTLILELTKLLEIDNKRRVENYASLEKLNNKLLNIAGDSFQIRFDENMKHLLNIRNTSIFNKILTLRDKKVAHVDNSKLINPFTFKVFSIEEIIELEKIIDIIKLIFNNCLSVFDEEIFLPSFTRTSNLLTFFEEYREFSHSRPHEFLKWKISIRKDDTL